MHLLRHRLDGAGPQPDGRRSPRAGADAGQAAARRDGETVAKRGHDGTGRRPSACSTTTCWPPAARSTIRTGSGWARARSRSRPSAGCRASSSSPRSDAGPAGALAARADDDLRTELMPVTKRFPLARLMARARYQGGPAADLRRVPAAGRRERLPATLAEILPAARPGGLSRQPDRLQPDRRPGTRPRRRRGLGLRGGALGHGVAATTAARKASDIEPPRPAGGQSVLDSFVAPGGRQGGLRGLRGVLGSGDRGGRSDRVLVGVGIGVRGGGFGCDQEAGRSSGVGDGCVMGRGGGRPSQAASRRYRVGSR